MEKTGIISWSVMIQTVLMLLTFILSAWVSILQLKQGNYLMGATIIGAAYFILNMMYQDIKKTFERDNKENDGK